MASKIILTTFQIFPLFHFIVTRLFSSTLNNSIERPRIKVDNSKSILVQQIVKDKLTNDTSLIIHHKDKNPKNNSFTNLEIMSRAEHAIEHKDYLKGLEIGRNEMFCERGKYRDRTKDKNSYLMKQYNKNQVFLRVFDVFVYVIPPVVVFTAALTSLTFTFR